MRKKIQCPTIASVRKMLTDLLPLDSEFEAFCIDRFKSTWHLFSNGMDRMAKTNVLLVKNDTRNIMAALAFHTGTTSFKESLEYDADSIVIEERSAVELYPYRHQLNCESNIEPTAQPRIVVRSVPDDNCSYQFSVINPSADTVILTDIIVNVHGMDGSLNGHTISGPTEVFRYQLMLPHIKGIFRYILPRPIRIMSNDAVTFALRFIPRDTSDFYEISIGFSIDEIDYFSNSRLRVNAHD